MPAAPTMVKLHARGGRWLAGIAAVICVGSEAGYLATGSVSNGLRLAPVFALVIVVFWLIFWAPSITISESGIAVANPLRTYQVPWSVLESTESRWVLTLVTRGRRIAVWAAPRQRSGVTGIEVRRDSYGLPDFAAEQQFERQSAPVSAGDVAERLITRRLSERPEPDAARRGDGTIAIRLHVTSIVALGILSAATVVGFSIH
jgi:hypothetical protein